jgi:hypothetical protein
MHAVARQFGEAVLPKYANVGVEPELRARKLRPEAVSSLFGQRAETLRHQLDVSQ